MRQAVAARTAAPAGHLARRRVIGLAAAVLALALVLWLSLALGARPTPFWDVPTALLDPAAGNTDHLVIRELRLPRTVIGLVAGAALGIAGAVMQGITRNPLADPGLLGVNAGASLFVVLAITLLGITAPTGYIWFAFGGALIAATLVYGIGAIGREGATPVKLALAGTALTAGITSIITLILITDIDTLSSYRFWIVGSLVGRDLSTVAPLLPFLIVGAVLAVVSARMLNALALGDDLARGLGQSVTLARVLTGVVIVLLCGSAVSLAGPIVFVGLVVPHLVRPFTGPDYRWIIALAAVVGPTLLLVADIIGRLIAPPGEFEASLVVAMIGAPVMIALVRRVKLAGL